MLVGPAFSGELLRREDPSGKTDDSSELKVRKVVVGEALLLWASVSASSLETRQPRRFQFFGVSSGRSGLRRLLVSSTRWFPASELAGSIDQVKDDRHQQEDDREVFIKRNKSNIIPTASAIADRRTRRLSHLPPDLRDVLFVERRRRRISVGSWKVLPVCCKSSNPIASRSAPRTGDICHRPPARFRSERRPLGR